MGKESDAASIVSSVVTTDGDDTTQRHFKTLNFLKRINVNKNSDGAGSSAASAITVEDDELDDERTKHRWWKHNRRDANTSDDFMDMPQERDPSPGAAAVFRNGFNDDMDREVAEEKYFTFKTNPNANQTVFVPGENVEEELWDERPSGGNKLFKKFWKKERNRREELGLYNGNDIQSMPMVNAFARNHGEWWDDTKAPMEDPNLQHLDYEPHELCHKHSHPAEVHRRKERLYRPNGERREVIEERFVMNADINPRKNDRRSNLDIFKSPQYRNQAVKDYNRRKKFDDRVREYQYYMNGVKIPGPRAPERPPTFNENHRSRAATKGISTHMDWPTFLNSNHNEQILEFHHKVRLFIAMVPIFSHFEPSLALLESAIPNGKDSNTTSGAALLICLLDVVITTATVYWSIKIYLFFSSFFQRVFWILGKLGIV